jgi:hypothetical protein
LRTAVAFFAGVLTSLFFLVPGKNGPTILINGDHNRQIAEIGQAGEKFEKLGDQALIGLYRAKAYVWQKMKKENKR